MEEPTQISMPRNFPVHRKPLYTELYFNGG